MYGLAPWPLMMVVLGFQSQVSGFATSENVGFQVPPRHSRTSLEL
jgi:hypothetical protein